MTYLIYLPIVARLMALQPELSQERASLYAPLIAGAAIELNLDWQVIVAIGMQESSWLPTNTPDMGFFQLNRKTASYYRINQNQFNLENGHEVYAHASFKSFRMVMKDKLNECRKYGEDAWSCYHSKTTSHRVQYLANVGRYLND